MSLLTRTRCGRLTIRRRNLPTTGTPTADRGRRAVAEAGSAAKYARFVRADERQAADGDRRLGLIDRRLPKTLRAHLIMATDAVRNEALHSALAAHVSSESRVLDVGAGVGTWAILAARLGAARVVAVELDELLIPYIHQHAVENGVAERIEIVHGDIDRVDLYGEFDVIIAELFGRNATGAKVTSSFASLRNRYLADGGLLIPQGMSVMAAPVRRDCRSVPSGLPISMNFLRSSAANYSSVSPMAERAGLEFLAEPVELTSISFSAAEEAVDVSDLSAQWALDHVEDADGIAVFIRHRLTDGVSIEGHLSASWGTTLYGFENLPAGPGPLTFRLRMEEPYSSWSVGTHGAPPADVRRYGPDLSRRSWLHADEQAPRLTFE